MTGYERALKAAVYTAFDLRDTVLFQGACSDVVDLHIFWPLVEANRELDRARAELDERRTRTAALTELIRSTYPAAACAS